MASNNFEREVTFEIIDNLGVITESPTGWTKELNIVRWNGGMPKYDIREWDESHERMSRGLTLTQKEMESVVDFFSGYEFMKNHEAENK